MWGRWHFWSLDWAWGGWAPAGAPRDHWPRRAGRGPEHILPVGSPMSCAGGVTGAATTPHWLPPIPSSPYLQLQPGGGLCAHPIGTYVMKSMSFLLSSVASYFVSLFFIVLFFSALDYSYLVEWLGISDNLVLWIRQFCCYSPLLFYLLKTKWSRDFTKFNSFNFLVVLLFVLDLQPISLFIPPNILYARPSVCDVRLSIFVVPPSVYWIFPYPVLF